MDKALSDPEKEYEFEVVGNKAGVWGQSNHRQRGVRPAGKRPNAMPLLTRFVEGLPRRRKHLGAFIGTHTSPEIDQHLP